MIQSGKIERAIINGKKYLKIIKIGILVSV